MQQRGRHFEMCVQSWTQFADWTYDIQNRRARHRAGLDQDSRGLYQYVVEEEVKSAPRITSGQQGPRVIDLNDAPKSEPKRR
jgi:hypothetical protein